MQPLEPGCLGSTQTVTTHLLLALMCLITFSVPQFPHLYNGDAGSKRLIEFGKIVSVTLSKTVGRAPGTWQISRISSWCPSQYYG